MNASLVCLIVLTAVAPPDRVTLSNGEVLEGRILGVRSGRLRIEIRIGNGRAELACEIPRISRIEPASPFSPDALPLDAQARLRLLRPLWAGQEPLVAVPGSDAGPAMIALAQALEATGSHEASLALLERTSKQLPDAALRHRADALRVQALVKLNRPDAALEVARDLDRAKDDPSGIALASLAKGRIEKGLTNLDVAIDCFLSVYLLHPDLNEEAAQGLWEASQTAIACGNSEPALRWLKTVVSDYSNTTTFAAASAALAAETAKETNRTQKASR